MTNKLDQQAASTIRRLYRDGVPGKILAWRFGVAKSTISAIINNQIWRDPSWQAERLLFDPRSRTRGCGAGTASCSGNQPDEAS